MIGDYLLPASIRSQAFIAGGFAACPALASDIDLWVSSKNLFADRLDILAWLQQWGASFVEHPLPLVPALTEVDYQESYLSNGTPVLKVATVTVPHHSKPVHIMVVMGDVNLTLAGFDISTHQVALTDNGVVLGPQWTSILVPPVMLLETANTRARLDKIARRYGHISEELF